MGRKPAKRKGIVERPAGSGTWWVRWTDWQDEKPRDRLKKIGRDYAEAVEFQAAVRKQAREHKQFPELARKERAEQEQKRRKSFTVADAVANYLATCRVAENTARNDRYHSKLITDTFGTMAAAKLTRAEIEAWMVERRQKLSDNTVNNQYGFLKRVLRRAVADGHLPADPTAAVKTFGTNKGKVRFLSLEEKTTLQNATFKAKKQAPPKPCFTRRQWLAVELAYRTGLRQSEQFALMWDCVFIERGHSTIVLPNTKAGTRQTVFLNKRAVEILRELRELSEGSEWVFPAARGEGPMSGHYFTEHVFRPALKAAGIRNFRWHDLRHTFASDLARAGVPLVDLQKLMRHASIQMSLRYIHLTPSHLAAAVEKVSIDF